MDGGGLKVGEGRRGRRCGRDRIKVEHVVGPDVRVGVAVREVAVVNEGAQRVPKVVVKNTVAPTVGIFLLNTSTRIVALLASSFLIPAPPHKPCIPNVFPKARGPVKSSTTA